MSTRGDFYNYRDKDGVRRVYELHWRGLCRRAPRETLSKIGDIGSRSTIVVPRP